MTPSRSRRHNTVIAVAATYQEIVVGQATPAAPAWNTKMPTAFPITLIRFAASDTHMVTFVLPMER